MELDERTLLDDERSDEDTTIEDDERVEDTEERLDEDDERIEEDEDRTDDDTSVELLDLLVDTEDTAPPQIAPVTAGVSIAPLLAFTCTPNATVCPGWILPFQLKLVAL